MGSLADCLQQGVPRDLLIPILPWNRSFGGKGAGKIPARFNPETQNWEGISEWQRGNLDPQTILKPSDEKEGNAGILLGAPSNGFQLIAIDIDLNEGPRAVGWRNGIVRLLQQRWDQVLLVRKTVDYRALVLVNLPVDEVPGGKRVFTLSHTDLKTPRSPSVRVGRIEVLSFGQQAVIAGVHHTGRRISWYYENGQGETDAPRYPAPPVKAGLPAFPTYDALVASVAAVLDEIRALGFSYTAVGADAGIGAPATLSDLAAPSVDALVGLIDQMPNPPEVDRDVYIAIMMAVGGARAGLVEARGALSHDEETRISHAVANWATRWQAPKGLSAGTFDEELAKWREDLGKPREERFAGWRRLLVHAQSVGASTAVLKDIATNTAQSQFTADTTTPVPQSMVVPGKPVMSGKQMMLRQGIDPRMVENSDVAIAERLLQEFSGNAIWVPGIGIWLFWDDNNTGWKSEDTTSAKVMVLVVDKLWWYCTTYGKPNPVGGDAGWSKTTYNSMMSHNKIERVTTILKGYLTKPMTEINCGILKLQTPNSMYDLVTMEPLRDIMQRKILHETRCTGVEPEMIYPGSTKYFDKLTMDLCDRNEAVHEWLMHYIGYCLLGEPNEDIFVVIWGSGGNGKSTLATVLQAIFGSYGVSINPEVIEETGRKLHPASLNRLRNKRLAVILEPEKGAKWNERILKMITGGDDIEARDMNKNPTPFRSQAGVIILSNEKPAFSNFEPAIQRRFRMIRTIVKRPDSENIKDLDDRIMEEAPWVLQKIMRYAQKVHADKQLPNPPPAMQAFVNDVMVAGDIIYGFLHDECVYGTTEVAGEEEDIEVLRKRCEDYMKRNKTEGEFAADKVPSATFLDRLRREGISLEDPTKVDSKGRPLRHRRVIKDKKLGIEQTVYVARGIKLRVKAVAA